MQKKKSKEDTVSSVPLLKTDFNHIKFSHAQLQFFKTIQDNFLTVCTGPAGTAKTFVACYAALNLVRDNVVNKIIISRPAVESGESLGFLPGSIDEKIAPYMKGFISNMEKIISPEKLKELILTSVIDMEPIAFMKSQTFDDTVLILDEAQNADLRQLMLVVTRMGKNSKIIICGDFTQWDIKARRKDLIMFNEHVIKDVAGCVQFQFTKEDIVRHPILIQITDNYEAYKEANSLD